MTLKRKTYPLLTSHLSLLTISIFNLQLSIFILSLRL